MSASAEQTRTSLSAACFSLYRVEVGIPLLQNAADMLDVHLGELNSSAGDQLHASCCVCVCAQVAATTDEKLNQPLLQFHDDSTPDMQLLAVNFDPALIRLLKETKYFLILDVKVCLGAQCWFSIGQICCAPAAPWHNLMSCCRCAMQVPDSALAIYQHTDRFRQQIGSLDLMVSLYNKLQRTTLPVEWPLVASKLEAVGEIASMRAVLSGLVLIFFKRVHVQVVVVSPCILCTLLCLSSCRGSTPSWTR